MKLYVLLWKHETSFTNGAGEHYEPEECQDCGVFTSEEAARNFAAEHLPKNANYDVFDGEYLFPDSTEEEIMKVIEIRTPTLEELIPVPDFDDNDFFNYLTHDEKSIWEVFSNPVEEPEIDERYLHGYEEAGVSESVLI